MWDCQELMGLIYSYDRTFHDQYKLVVEEFEMEEDYGDIMNLIQFRDDNDTTTEDEETTDDEDEYFLTDDD